jgi:mRNA deadenylase 3'-5' endonuclease subunit Ccr4
MSNNLPHILAAKDSLLMAVDTPQNISLLSYNILIPNHQASWWVSKYYHPAVHMSTRHWPARRTLLVQQLLHAHSDIICLQEVDAQHFKEDFDTLLQQGYQALMHQKGRFMRCATFWKYTKFSLLAEAHSYRCLLTLLQIKSNAVPLEAQNQFTIKPENHNATLVSESPKSIRPNASAISISSNSMIDQSSTPSYQAHELLLVINVHLAGGPKPDARIQQVHKALKKAYKMFATYHIPADQAQIILCGDYNSVLQDHALATLLFEGRITPQDRDLKYPQICLTTKEKIQPFTRWVDAYKHAYPHASTHLAPSLLSRDFIAYFCQFPTDYSVEVHDHLTFSELLYMHIMHARTEVPHRGIEVLLPWLKPQFLQALFLMFSRFAYEDEQGNLWMESKELEAWIMQIQGQEKRGSEYYNMMAYLAGESVQEIIIQNKMPKVKSKNKIENTAKSKDDQLEKQTSDSSYFPIRSVDSSAVPIIKSKKAPIRKLDFITWRNLYLSEILYGKWWSIAHDLMHCQVYHDLLPIPPLSSALQESHKSPTPVQTLQLSSAHPHTSHIKPKPLYQTRLDHILIHNLSLKAVRATIDGDDLSYAQRSEQSIPNPKHPSDHFPLAIVFTCDQVS